MARYSRKWKVHVIQSVHAMLGWARSYEQSQQYHEAEVRNNLDLMDRTDAYPPDERHRFAWDSSWVVGEYLKRRPDDVERVRRRMAEGRLEVSPHEASISAHCLSGEEMIRSFARRAELERQGRGGTRTFVQTDIQSLPAGFPSLIAGCGMKYVMAATNTHPVYGFQRYPPADVTPRGHALFWWKGPDGRRVLCFSYGGYHEASVVGTGEDFNPVVLEAFLQRFEAMGEFYPYDAVVLFGTGGDAIRAGGFHHTLEGTERLRRWNAEGGGDPDNLDAPLLINGRLQGFFEYIEERYGDRIPAFTGGWGGGALLWDTQAQRFAKAGLQARQSSARVRAAEMLAASAAALLGAEFPGKDIDEVFQYRLWHDEHDANGTRSLVSHEVKQEWRAIHQRWGSEKLERPSQALMRNALSALARGLPNQGGKRIMVYNPVSRMRTDVVRWPCPPPGHGMTWQVADDATGQVLPSQYVFHEDAGQLLFIARDVRSLGYRTYTIGCEVPVEPDPRHDALSRDLENEFFRVRMVRDGAIRSIFDKKASREIVRPDGRFNLYINGRDAAVSGGAVVDEIGPVARSLRISVSALPPRTQRLRAHIWLYAGIARIDIFNEFAVEEAVQEVYYDFPMDLDGPLAYTLEGASGTIITPGRNEFDETKRTHWNTFSFVDVSSPDYGITLFSPDARQAYLGASLGEGDPVSDLGRASVLMRLIGGADPLQDWFDNNGGPADNPFRYRFSLTTHEGPVNVSRAVDEGWAQLFPLEVCPLEDRQAGRLPPHSAGLWHVPAPLLVSAFKKAWAGAPDEYILRLWNPADAAVERASITSDLFTVRCARFNDHLERDMGGEIPVSGGTFSLSVAAHGTVTLRLALASKGG